ncbi:hypothetical protein ACIA8O_38885 [Kitasatospora sp. NPDC051853]|uniref:hypothetical protein n=1 Tax=Kitasatospora sp. NPDC051853 TaxID=3364058 RepID=UPI0037B602FD
MAQTDQQAREIAQRAQQLQDVYNTGTTEQITETFQAADDAHPAVQAKRAEEGR